MIFDFLSNEVRPLKYFFRQLLRYYVNLPIEGSAIYSESLVEYKRPEILYGGTEKAARELIDDIPQKLARKGLVVYCIGIDGKTREIFIIDPGSCGDDCINEIFEEVRGRLKPLNISVLDPIFVSAKGISKEGKIEKGHLLIFYAKKDNAEVYFGEYQLFNL